MPQHQAESHSQKPTKKARRRRRRIHRRKNAALPSRKCGSGRAAYWILFFDSLGVRITSVEKIGVLHLFCAPLVIGFQLFGNRVFRNFSISKPCIKRENTALSCSVFRCCIFWQHNMVEARGVEPLLKTFTNRINSTKESSCVQFRVQFCGVKEPESSALRCCKPARLQCVTYPSAHPQLSMPLPGPSRRRPGENRYRRTLPRQRSP